MLFLFAMIACSDHMTVASLDKTAEFDTALPDTDPPDDTADTAVEDTGTDTAEDTAVEDTALPDDTATDTALPEDTAEDTAVEDTAVEDTGTSTGGSICPLGPYALSDGYAVGQRLYVSGGATSTTYNVCGVKLLSATSFDCDNGYVHVDLAADFASGTLVVTFSPLPTINIVGGAGPTDICYIDTASTTDPATSATLRSYIQVTTLE